MYIFIHCILSTIIFEDGHLRQVSGGNFWNVKVM